MTQVDFCVWVMDYDNNIILKKEKEKVNGNL